MRRSKTNTTVAPEVTAELKKQIAEQKAVIVKLLEENLKLKATVALEENSELDGEFADLDKELAELKANELTKEEINREIDELTLFDDEFARLVLRHKEPVQAILQIALDHNPHS